MAHDTFETKGYNSVIWDPRGIAGAIIREFRADGADIEPGRVVTMSGGTAPDIDLPGTVTSDEIPLGIVIERYDVDIDTPFANNDDFVPVVTIAENQGLGVVVWRGGSPGAASVVGEFVTFQASTGATINWAYTDAARETDSLAQVVGRAAEAIASNTNELLIRIWLGV